MDSLCVPFYLPSPDGKTFILKSQDEQKNKIKLTKLAYNQATEIIQDPI